jgi:Dipeptidyl peptidase IV (DPP IV) N-terminal region
MINHAKWSPTKAKIAYVLNHDIYIHDMSTSQTERLTYDGNENIFNGVADWVYEGYLSRDVLIDNRGSIFFVGMFMVVS